jgi:hypothetical protein
LVGVAADGAMIVIGRISRKIGGAGVAELSSIAAKANSIV